jgi:hypothetical protein
MKRHIITSQKTTLLYFSAVITSKLEQKRVAIHPFSSRAVFWDVKKSGV